MTGLRKKASEEEINLLHAAIAEPIGLRFGVVAHAEQSGRVSAATVAGLPGCVRGQAVGVVAKGDAPFGVGFGEGHWGVRYH